MTKLYINGKFYINQGIFAQAVLVENGRFVAVGTTEEVIAAASDSENKIIDLGGRTVLPGFNDSHMHLYGVGMLQGILKLNRCRSIKDCVQAGLEYIAEKSVLPGQTIVAKLWNQENFTDSSNYLTCYDLDKISTQHPIVAYRACSHIASCNSLALEMANIGSDTVSPHGGEIYRDDNLQPTGVLAENAIELIKGILPQPNIEETAEIIESAMLYAASHGITSVQTNDVRDGNFADMLAAYSRVYDAGQAVLRTYHQCFFSDTANFAKFVEAGYFTGYGDDMFKIGPLKMFADGSLGGRTAALQQPYHDAPETKGIFTMTPEHLDNMIDAAEAAGFSCAVHAIGDGAMDMVLTAFEKTTSGENTRRHGIIHCQITDLAILRRMAQGGILALVQPVFLHEDAKIITSRVGPQLAKTSYAWATMDDMGINVSYGTDSPVEGLCPIDNIHSAVNRLGLDGEMTEPFNPSECVSVAQAIDSYTIGSAFASFDENKKGRIAPGFLADMCVLDKDIFEIDKSKILSVGVDMTILGGEVVYQKK